jgi:hypothetical protein
MGTKAILFGLLITVTCLTPAPAPAQSAQSSSAQQIARSQQAIQAETQRSLSTGPGDDTNDNNTQPSLHPKQKLSIMQANFAKAKSDAAELAALARELREELNKPNANDLSPAVVNRAEKIGKLARKIREETKAY